MSLIEAALRKLQENQSGPDRRGKSGPVVVGALKVGPVDAVQSSKRIEIDREALRSAGLLLSEAQSRQLSSQYRRIKRPLLAAAVGRGADQVPMGHIIMVASALPGEGKSFTTMNLALSLALEKDINVLLVDADIAKPDISRAFGAVGEPGLVDALQVQDRDVESYVIPTDLPGLSILPAGRHVETATELLASERMKQVVKRLEEVDTRRIVIFDSPPLLLTSESAVLSDVVGQIVVVVRAGVTSRQAVADALSNLAEGKAVSMILNQSVAGDLGGYYGYGEYGTEAATPRQ